MCDLWRTSFTQKCDLEKHMHIYMEIYHIAVTLKLVKKNSCRNVILLSICSFTLELNHICVILAECHFHGNALHM